MCGIDAHAKNIQTDIRNSMNMQVRYDKFTRKCNQIIDGKLMMVGDGSDGEIVYIEFYCVLGYLYYSP